METLGPNFFLVTNLMLPVQTLNPTKLLAFGRNQEFVITLYFQ